MSGFVALDRMLANSGARVGDVLLLTKAVGSGIITTAIKGELIEQDEPARCGTRCVPSTRLRFAWPRGSSFTAAPMSRALA